MKKSHLTLAILTAVLVSACGGSSSNDDATKDHGKPITPSKTTPTTPTKTTPTTPTTNDNSAKKPSTPTTPTTPSDSTPTTPTKTTTPTPTETTTPAKTLEQAKKDLSQDTKKLEDATKEANDLAEKLGQKLTKKKDAEKALKELATKIGKNTATSVEVAAAQVALANATLDADNAQVTAAEAGIKQLEAQKSVTEDAIAIATGEERDTVKAEKELVRAKFLLAQMNKFLATSKANVVKDDSDKKQAEADHLQAQYDAKVNDLVTANDASANAYQEAKQALSNAAVSGDKEQLTAAQKKFSDAKTALEGGNSSLKDIGEKLADARTKAKEAASKAEESKKAAEEAQELTPEEQAMKEEVFSPYNGVRFSEAKNDTFGEVRSVSYDEGKGKWSIVFKDKTDAPLMVDVPKDNASKPYGTFTAGKDGSTAQGVKATAYSAYGYVGDKFFSVGKLISLKDYVSKAIKAAAGENGKDAPKELKLKYQGTAFVNATVKGKDKPQAQVADFEATATFGDSNTLTGSFSHFQPYDSDEEKFNKLTQKTEAATDPVSFESKIDPKNSSFATAEDKADVKVQGFFYEAMNGKDESSAVGGLVDSKKEGHVFKGAFGGEQVSQPATTQPTTTQPTTTQTAGQ